MNKSLNGLDYRGIVTLKIINSKTKRVKKSKSICNNGTSSLFFFLCKCLTMQYDKTSTPTSIDASSETYEGIGGTLSTSLAHRALISSQGVIKNYSVQVEGDILEYEYVARFSAIIPYSIIFSSATIVEGGENVRQLKSLYLHSSSYSGDANSSLLAYVNIEDGIKIKEGESLLIEWNMGFKNPTISV